MSLLSRPLRFTPSRLSLCLATTLALSHAQAGGDARQSYSPYAGKAYPQHVYFGDTHNHTTNSGDAFANGNRLSPEQAYRLARGEEVTSSTGVPVRLSRPLDFLVVADHAEGLGIMAEVYDGNPALVADPTLARWSQAMKQGGQTAAAAMREVVAAQAKGTLPPPLKDPKIMGPVLKSVWQDYTATAERFNEPGRFTALLGYEWSSVPGGNNLHRNVIFRDGKDKVDQILPFSSWQSPDPEKLWDWLGQYEDKTGGRVLAIPHNANLSNGRMFELADFAGKPLSKDYAERRARWEVLQEVVQTKGASETHPSLSPTDEFAGFGQAGWELGNLNLSGERATAQMRPTTYLRAGLLRGLEQEQKIGANPFKFGLIGSSDVHTSLTAIEEDNFIGKHVETEPKAERWKQVSNHNLAWGNTDNARYTWQYLAAGYAAVWATENSREAIWDALQRKEVYATSGTRLTVRFFAGWNFTTQDANSRQLADIGYAKGVPMGGDLPARPAQAKAPSFLIAAMKDPQFANLDRIQIVKGWVDARGQGQEKVYDVVWSDADKRRIGADGKLTAVGDTVNVADASWQDSIGAAQLTSAWTDPDFDPSQRAFYYARVIEIPSPRWTAYDAKRFGVQMGPEVEMKQQERAWTSPIWYTPRG